MLLLLNGYDLSGAIGIAGVIQISSAVPVEGRIDNILLIEPEEVAVADSLMFVYDLTLVGDLVPDAFPYVLNDDVSGSQVLVREEPIPVNLARSDLDALWLGLAESILHGHW